jgi:hypothetical protein
MWLGWVDRNTYRLFIGKPGGEHPCKKAKREMGE